MSWRPNRPRSKKVTKQAGIKKLVKQGWFGVSLKEHMELHLIVGLAKKVFPDCSLDELAVLATLNDGAIIGPHPGTYRLPS